MDTKTKEKLKRLLTILEMKPDEFREYWKYEFKDARQSLIGDTYAYRVGVAMAEIRRILDEDEECIHTVK